MSTNHIDPQQLRTHHLFAGLGDGQLARVIRSARILHLDEGEHLFECGQEAEQFFLLRSGGIKLFLLSPDGMEKVIHLVPPGDTFAEAIMFMDSQIYPVNASAVKDSEIIAFMNSTFRDILRDSVDTCFRLMADMSTWLKKQLMEIDALTLQNATLRFTNYLLQAAPADSGNTARVQLGAPKNVIASRLSIQPESFSRILRNMQKTGLITVDGNSVVIKDLEALRAHGT